MKELISLFKDITLQKAIIISASALSILLPGILFIYAFNPVLFSGDVLKIQLLSSAISFGLQLILWIVFLIYFLEPMESKLVLTEKGIWMAILFSAFFCSGELLMVSSIKMWGVSCFKAIIAITICVGLNFIFLIDAFRDYKARISELKTYDDAKKKSSLTS